MEEFRWDALEGASLADASGYDDALRAMMMRFGLRLGDPTFGYIVGALRVT
jgi:hypothetical protein